MSYGRYVQWQSYGERLGYYATAASLQCCPLLMTTHTVLPNIVTIHKLVKIEMVDKSVPPYKFTDLC
jgi:hypothetical protein